MQENIQINNTILERFLTLEQKGRLAHAYLFVGSIDSGKGETALGVAKLLNCEQLQENMFCDQCSVCRKINTANHPDVHMIDNGFGESIKIEQIRELLSQIKLRPFSARKKIFILRNIENMTLEGANALLKTLEEPSANSLLILTTSVIEKNLDTVRSRCHVMYFLPSSNTGLERHLTKDYDEESSQAHFLAYFAEGCLGRARKLKDQGFFDRKNEIIDRFIVRGADEAYVKKILGEKEKTKEFLDVFLSWIRDAMLVKAKVEDGRLAHIDRLNELKSFQEEYSFPELSQLYMEVVQMCKLLEENLNIKIPLAVIRERLNHG